MTLTAAKTTRLKWAINQDLIKTGVTLERLRLLSKLGFFDDWPEAEQQRTERVLNAYADTFACLNREPHTADEAAMMRAQIDGNLEFIHDFLASEPAYLREPEFSEILLKTVLISSEKGGLIEKQREVGHK